MTEGGNSYASSAELGRNPLALDPRVDPRIVAVLGDFPGGPASDVLNREELLTHAESATGREQRRISDALMAGLADPALAPIDGLTIRSVAFQAHPGGSTLNLQVIRPVGTQPLPCVYYIHGGGMMTMSCYNEIYQVWGRLIAREGVAVALIDFRNCLYPSSVPEVAPYPAALDDCVAGVRYVVQNAVDLGVDPSRVIVAGESGGGNLALAVGLKLARDGDIDLISGLYALCPYLAGRWPDARFPSSSENNGILIDLHNNRGAHAYGIDELCDRNPLAWPSYATEDDVRAFPKTVISVNECDVLRDEGIAFYRLLARAGVTAHCSVVVGSVHATEIFTKCCPELSVATAAGLAHFARSTPTVATSQD